ncbi:MAG: hypothetical protein KDA28_09975, partial [Phycisphaerales bacterium]|nr:hypothetical protein [Phycisphaerales bacterium]
MTPGTRTQLVAIGVMLLSMGGAAILAPSVAASAGRHRLTYAETAEDGDPPQVAMGIAMGAFRGFFVNFLWIRANELKEEGKFHEAIELSSAITKLQPRFPRVWAFHAWNMAYNISVTTQTPEERWQWVQAGIRLLRDQAIVANPNDMLLHKELGWIYLHKIQGYTDDANMYYKRQIAARWTVVLGPPPVQDPLNRSREADVRAYTEDWIRPIADAPRTMGELYDASPTVRDLADKVQAATEQPLDEDMLIRITAWNEAYVRNAGSALSEQIRRNQGPKSQAFDEVWSAASETDRALLTTYIRRKVLISTYKMDPNRMIRLMNGTAQGDEMAEALERVRSGDTADGDSRRIGYGPIDWRHPAAHALYWSTKGVEAALTRWTEENKRDFDFINSDRVVSQSIQELWRSGNIFFSYLAYVTGDTALYLATPNTHFVESYVAFVDDEAVDRAWTAREKRPFRTAAAGYENLVKDAIRFYYRRGQRDEAERWLRHLRTWPGRNLNSPDFVEMYSLPLDEFVREAKKGRYTSPSVAVQEINGALQSAYIDGLVRGDTDPFEASFDYAREFHRYLFNEQFRETLGGGDAARMEWFMDRDFGFHSGIIFAQLAEALSLEHVERMYDAAPLQLKRYAYDLLVQIYKRELDRLAEQNGTRPFDDI